MGHKTTRLLLGLILFGATAAAQYSPPAELVRTYNPTLRLNHFDTTYVSYTCSAEAKKVVFRVFWRSSPTGAWKRPVVQTETVPYYMTAIAPVYSGDWNKLYVIGVLSDGKTTIERWKVVITIPTGGGIPKVTVTKDHVLTSATLTHIRAAAASPNEQFLVMQRHETKEVLKLNLPSGSTTVLLTPTSYPKLAYYDVIDWQQHVAQGDAFRIRQGRRSDVISHTGSILFWDANLDGVPNLIEDLSAEQYKDHGYNESGIWQPNRTLLVFD